MVKEIDRIENTFALDFSQIIGSIYILAAKTIGNSFSCQQLKIVVSFFFYYNDTHTFEPKLMKK